jgi:hypothetical protein
LIRPTDILLDTEADLVDQLRASSQQTLNTIVSSLGVTLPTEAVKESSKMANAVTLANGVYGGWRSSNDASIYCALGAGAKVQKQVVVTADCIMDGIHFVSSDLSVSNLVVIKVGATVVFRNCVFEKRSGDGDGYLALEAPVGATVAKANLIGCVFKGPNRGAVVTNPGAAANVNTIGCYDKTGGGFGGTTATGNL